MIKRRMEMPVDSSPERDTIPETSPLAESEPFLLKKQDTRKTTLENVDFDDGENDEEEPPTIRRPVIAEEVSEVRPVQRRREPKIVPPKNGEEMLRRRQELVRRRAQGERVPQQKKEETHTNGDTVLGQNIEQHLQRLSETLREVRTFLAHKTDHPNAQEEADRLTKELFHHRDSLDDLMTTLHKMRISPLHEFRSNISRSLMDLEDALHDIHK